MRVKIKDTEKDQWIQGEIRKANPKELPSIQDGWRFNFGKRLAERKYAKAFVLVSTETPTIIEGTLIFGMQDKEIPYMAFVEVAPHNRTDPKKYEEVGACLIAYACKLSIIHGAGPHKGWLTFDVEEENPEDEKRLMQHYSKYYNAVRLDGTTTMFIMPDDCIRLIEKYLER